MNGEVYEVGTVVNNESSNTTVIVGILLGIVAALVLGASLALIVMIHLRKKNRGEETFGCFSNHSVQLEVELQMLIILNI